MIRIVPLLLFLTCGQPNASSTNVATGDTITIKTGKEPGCVEVADVNNDRFADLIITTQMDSSGSVMILLGEGNAKFQEAPGSPFPAGHNVNDVAIGDFNNDSNPDLSFANHERKYVTVLYGNGKGSFRPAPASPFPLQGIPHVHGIAIADLNKDGRLDLITDSWGNDQIEVHAGNNRTLFDTQAVFFKTGKRPYQRHRAADVNGDGNPDVVTTNTEGNDATVLLGDGKGGLAEAKGSPFPCGDNPFGIAIGDVNGDGKPDLAVVNSPGSMAEGKGRNGVTVLLGDGTGAFTKMKGSPFESGKIPNRIAIGDVNGDGINDIVSSDNDDDKIYLLLMTRGADVPRSLPITVGNHPKGVAIADLNGDGKGEIIVCNTLDDNVKIILSK